jgi:3-methyl-2-oxobutanoate hydroxymethyltransferase
VPPCWCWRWCPPAVAELTAELPHCHTIGIGAGNGTAGQVLVLHDMLGMNLGKMAKFVHNFMQDAGSVRGAMEAYVRAVKPALSRTTPCTPGKTSPSL